MEARQTAKDRVLGAETAVSVDHPLNEPVAALLKKMCETKIKAVEALTAAMRHYARFPKAALNFASQAAVEARHLGMLTGRVYELNGTLAPSHSGTTAVDSLSDLKVVGRGSSDEMAEFVFHLYLDQHERVLFSEASARLLEGDKLTQKMVSKVARDERSSLALTRSLLDWLASEGHAYEAANIRRKSTTR